MILNRKFSRTIMPVLLVVALLASFIGAITPVSAATEDQTKDAGTGANLTDVGTVDWETPGNITLPHGDPRTTATAIPIDGGITNYLRGNNYGFTVPPNALINGITVVINRTSNADATALPALRDNRVSLIKGGAIQTVNKAKLTTDWPLNQTYVSESYGGSGDLWGTTWTREDINNANFGVVISVANPNTSETW
ncbi:MAG: putative Ig protein, partial [Chloroflexi bacterium]|nr:putative Ig protein [Chloroflexota bacterium]